MKRRCLNSSLNVCACRSCTASANSNQRKNWMREVLMQWYVNWSLMGRSGYVSVSLPFLATADLYYSYQVCFRNQHLTINRCWMHRLLTDHSGKSLLELQIKRTYTCRTELVSYSRKSIFSNWDILRILIGGVRFHHCGRMKVNYETREGIAGGIIGHIHQLV